MCPHIMLSRRTPSKGRYAWSVYGNFEKACVTVKHILLNKLNHYRVRGPESNLFDTYLGGRQQHTTVDSFPSKNAYITYGIQQGCLKTEILTDLHKWFKQTIQI